MGRPQPLSQQQMSRARQCGESMALASRSHEIVGLSTYFCPGHAIWCILRSFWGGVGMSYRVKAASLAAIAVSCVAAMLAMQGPASAASECLTKIGKVGEQSGHWYYRLDRVHHRRCWFFEA